MRGKIKSYIENWNIMFVLFVLALSISCKKNTIIYTDEDFVRTTKDNAKYYCVSEEFQEGLPLYKCYFISNDNLQFKGRMVFNDLNTLEGTCVWYYENGNKYRRGNFKKGKNDGFYEFWNQKETKLYSAFYKDENIDGKYEYFYDNGEILLRGYETKDTDNDGIETYYLRSGKKFHEWYEDENISIFYYNNGNKMEYSKVDEKKQNFEFYFYYPDGKEAISIIGITPGNFFKNNLTNRNGSITYYSENRNFVYNAIIKNGQLNVMTYTSQGLINKIDSLRIKILNDAYSNRNKLYKEVEKVDDLMNEDIY